MLREIKGTPGQDTLAGTDSADLIYGGQGADVIDGGGGDDVIRGQGAADVLDGGLGRDTVLGNAGDDLLDGGVGRDVLLGGAGDDLLFARDGGDRLTGGDGADEFAVDIDQGDHRLGRVVVTDLGADDDLAAFLFFKDEDGVLRHASARAALDSDRDGRIDAGDDFAHATRHGLALDLGAALDHASGRDGAGTTGTVVLAGLDHLDANALA